MGNSTITLQDVADYALTIGELQPFLPVGGYSVLQIKNLADDVMAELIAQRFNWKWNRILCPPFLTISRQQDYCTVGLKTIGWLEHCCIVDINNTALPKPVRWPEAVRDLERTSGTLSGWPEKICWLPNDQMVEAAWNSWPGASQIYVNPLGTSVTPVNPPTNILDAHGNILILTTFGTTGATAPDAGVSPAPGATVSDGSAVWTVADPKAQGFRIAPMPSGAGVAWEVHVVAQARAPRFTTLQQTLDPIPDDYKKWFQDGFIAYCYRNSSTPSARGQFEVKRREWLQALTEARGQGDREREDAMFVPDRSLMQGGGSAMPLGPAWPYGS